MTDQPSPRPCPVCKTNCSKIARASWGEQIVEGEPFVCRNCLEVLAEDGETFLRIPGSVDLPQSIGDRIDRERDTAIEQIKAVWLVMVTILSDSIRFSKSSQAFPVGGPEQIAVKLALQFHKPNYVFLWSVEPNMEDIMKIFSNSDGDLPHQATEIFCRSNPPGEA